MNAAKPHAEISSLLAERIAANDFPSAVYLAAERNQIRFADALGFAVVNDSEEGKTTSGRAARVDTIYDLASLTKPLVTGLLCARSVEQGALNLDARIADYLIEFERADKRRITVRQLLTHTSGLPAWLPLSIATRGEPRRTLDRVASEPLAYTPDTQVVYSDLGFILLGFLLERISGASLIELAAREIFIPLKLRRTFFNPGKSFLPDIAASERGNFYERGMCEGKWETGESKGWREDLIHGEVHDGNAHFLGGAAGHAGLFSTAEETFTLAKQFIVQSTRLLAPETCLLFRRNMTAGLNEARSFAWQLAISENSTAGSDLPPDAFGHTGFAGTSCWIDADRERVFVLLTNRTHHRALPFVNINSTRRRFHTLAVNTLNKTDAKN